MKNVVKFLKKNKIVVAVVAVLLVALIVFLIVKPNKKDETLTMSSIEEIKLKEVSADIIPYFENIEDNDSTEIDRYIIFALEYIYNKEGKNTISLSEMKDLINSKFKIDTNEEELERIGITPLMLDKSITFEMMDKTYKINKIKLSLQDIAAQKITTYALQEMKKKSSNEYIVTYKKCVVTNPYEILNYYMDLNNQHPSPETDPETGEPIEEEKEEPIVYDTTEINKYLKGEESINTIKKYITAENISEIGEDAGTITVTFVVENGNIMVSNVSK